MLARILLALSLAASAWPAMAASPLDVTSRIMVERRVSASDGTTRVATAAARRAVPGDRLIVALAYRNTGSKPIADLVLADPVPKQLSYRAPADGSPAPDVSVDGQHFAALTALRVPVPGGGTRAAVVDDVTAVRWRLPAPVAAGAGATLAFRAVLK